MQEFAIDPENSAYAQAASQWAAENSCWLIYSCTRKSGSENYNSSLIYNRQGELIGYYDKIHLQAHDHKYTRGDRLDVFESDFGIFGVMICADRRWPETVRSLAVKGARIIFNPTYGTSNDMNLAMMRTRSYESEVFIAFTHPGQSLITGPQGQVMQYNENSEQKFMIADIDLAAVDQVRAGPSSHLKDRRGDLYTLK